MRKISLIFGFLLGCILFLAGSCSISIDNDDRARIDMLNSNMISFQGEISLMRHQLSDLNLNISKVLSFERDLLEVKYNVERLVNSMEIIAESLEEIRDPYGTPREESQKEHKN